MRSEIAHAGRPIQTGVHPLVDPIAQSSVYAFDDSDQADHTFAEGGPLYARDGLPNVRALERAVAGLEGADDAIAVSSGMAAIAITCLALLGTGDHVVIGHDGYCDTSALLQEMANSFNLRITRVDLNDAVVVRNAIDSDTTLVLAETISNPGMRLTDLAAVSAITRSRGVKLIVDNTFATPVLCRPLEFGADAVIHSAGKFLAGHSDVTAGVVAGGADLVAQLKRSAYLYGPLLAPMEAWLTLRGIKTLLPRVDWSSLSAARIAGWLVTHPSVEAVNYAGLCNHQQSALAARMLPRGAGSVLSFRLAGGEGAAARMVGNLRSIPYAPSIGGTVTIASYPPLAPIFNDCGEQVVAPYRSSTIRLSVGLEDPDDIIAELDEALTASLDEGHSATKGSV